jgi:hypothetical protein
VIILGWGNKGTHLAYLGIDKCANCKNYNQFNLFEFSKRVTAYFIPIAKFDKKFYCVCRVCDAAWEMTLEQKDEALRQSVTLPPGDQVADIWGVLDKRIMEAPVGTDEEFENDLIEAVNLAKASYPSDAVDYVFAWYLKALADPDKPK